jgi:hypothetical protein
MRVLFNPALVLLRFSVLVALAERHVGRQCRKVHPRSWRITMTTPAHAPKLNATASHRMMIERQPIEFRRS